MKKILFLLVATSLLTGCTFTTYSKDRGVSDLRDHSLVKSLRVGDSLDRCKQVLGMTREEHFVKIRNPYIESLGAKLPPEDYEKSARSKTLQEFRELRAKNAKVEPLFPQFTEKEVYAMGDEAKAVYFEEWAMILQKSFYDQWDGNTCNGVQLFHVYGFFDADWKLVAIEQRQSDDIEVVQNCMKVTGGPNRHNPWEGYFDRRPHSYKKSSGGGSHYRHRR
jgi:hypothetical protein